LFAGRGARNLLYRHHHGIYTDGWDRDEHAIRDHRSWAYPASVTTWNLPGFTGADTQSTVRAGRSLGPAGRHQDHFPKGAGTGSTSQTSDGRFHSSAPRGHRIDARQLGHLDALVFTDVIGETEPLVRERACAAFGFLDLRLNLELNASSPPDKDIAAADSAVRVLIIKGQENWQIAAESFAAWRRTSG
jgi:Acetokinase family